MYNLTNLTKRVLLIAALLVTLLPSALRAQDLSDYFTVVLFGDPEVNMTDRPGNNATQANLTRWAEGIVNMHNNDNGYFNFQNQPAGYKPKADLVICMGDMDEDSEKSGTAIKAVFKKFTDANIPFITMIGNHDVVPDRWNNGQVGATTLAGHNANTFAFNLVTSYLNTAKGNGIENVKRFESENGDNQAKPFTFTFKGVRFYIGQTYWFQKTYDNDTPLWGTGNPPTTYIPYDVVDELDAFVQANASTPSVWVQHYPLQTEDRWWNDTNENGGYIVPANENANMKTADQKRTRYKQIIGKSTNPYHFSGHNHSAAKRSYTDTGGASFTEYIAPYFATNGSAYIALCKRGEGVLEVRQVCFDPNYQTSTVQDLGQLSNDKAYIIRAANGYLTYNPSVTNAASGKAGTLDAANANNHWAIVNQNGINYLYSIGAHKFARKPANASNSNGTVLELVDTPDANSIVTFEFNNSAPDYPWLIKFGGVLFNVSTGQMATHGLLLGGWTTLDGGNRFAFSEANVDFEGMTDVTEALDNAGLADLVTTSNLTTGWYQLWAEAIVDNKLIKSVSQMSSPKSDPSWEGNLASLIDDDPSTYWHSSWHQTIDFGDANQMQHYVQFDLGAAYQHLSLAYRCRNAANDRPTSFSVTASNDPNGTFNEVTTITGIATNADLLQYFNFDLGANYRYIRLRATATSAGNRGYWHAAEMQFYPHGPKLITSVDQLSSPRSDNHGSEGNLSALIDDNASTYWHTQWGTSLTVGSAEQMQHYVQFDLGASYRDLVFSYRSRASVTANRPTSFSVTASNEANGTFTEVATVAGVGTNSAMLQNFNLDLGANYRYIRLRATATESNNGFWHAAEMQFFATNRERLSAYYRTLNISDAPTISGNSYDMASAPNNSDLSTYFYLERVGNGQVRFHLPTGYSVGSGTSRTNEHTANVITVTAPDADPALLQLKNDANHGNNYWFPFNDAAYADGMIIGAGVNATSQRWKLLKANDDLADYDTWTVCPAVEGASIPTVRYNATGYTGVSEFTSGGLLLLPKGNVPSASDFTVDDPEVTVDVDEANKRIVVRAKVYRLGQRITDQSQIRNGAKYMILHAMGTSQNGFFCRWVKNNNGAFALESSSSGLPAALQLAPLDVNAYADKIWTFTTVSGGFSITNTSNGTKTQTISISDYATGGTTRGGNNGTYPDPRFYFEDMSDGKRSYSNCAEGDGFWLIRNGTSGSTYWNGGSGSSFTTWENGHPYSIFVVEEVTGLETNYGVSSNAQGCVSRDDNRHIEWASLKVNDAEPIMISDLQQRTNANDEYRPVYFNRTGTKVVCQTGATLTAAVDAEHQNAMQAFFFIDEDGDGFEDGINAVDNSQHKVLPGHDLKTLSGYQYGGSAWYNSLGESSTSSTMAMPAFTAPSKPGIFRVRYLVAWNSVDPNGYANIASHGGCIVDVTLEVQPSDVYNLTLADAANIRANVLNRRGLGYPRTESEAYISLDAALTAAENRNGSNDAQLLSELKTAIVQYYTCTDVELPEAGHSYSVQYVDAGMPVNTFLLVANDDEEGTVRLVGPIARYYNGTTFSNGYSPLDNNLKIAKAGFDADHLGCLKIGDNELATRWTEVESPSAVTPTYGANNDGSILMTLPGVNTSIVAVYANDVEITDDVTVTAGTNTTVLLPLKPNRTWFTVLVADPSGVRRFQYQVLNFQNVTIELINDATGVSETSQRRLSIGSTMVELMAEWYPKCVIVSTTHDEIQEGVTTGYIVHYTPNYPVHGLGNNSHASRYTESVSLTVGTAPAVTVATGQNAVSPIYVDKRSETFVCGKNQPLQPVVNFHGHAMHAYVYVDANHDGFLASAADINTDNNRLKTGNGIDLRTFSYYNGYNSLGEAKSSDEGETNCVAMPAFNAPSVPGTYVMRYKVDWDSLDPDGTPEIASNGGIIVDVTLEVREYNLKVIHRYGDVTETFYEYFNSDEATGWSPKRIMVPAGYAPQGEWFTRDIDEDYNGSTVEIRYTYSDDNLPFTPTALGPDGHPAIALYSTMTVHGKDAYYNMNPSSGNAENQIKLGTRSTRNLNDYFYFVGDNIEGFTMHSAAVSPGLSFDIASRKFTKAVNKYILVELYPDGVTRKYAFRVKNSQAAMNEDNGNSGNLGVWNSPNLNSEYTHFTFAAADEAAAAALAATPEPQSGTYCYIKSGYAAFAENTAVKAAYIDGAQAKWKTFDPVNLDFLWKVTRKEGGYTLLNVGTTKYLKQVGANGAVADENVSYLVNLANGKFEIVTSAEGAIHCGGHSNGQGNSGELVNWYGDANGPSTWVFAEPVADEIAELSAGTLTEAKELAALADYASNLDAGNRAALATAISNCEAASAGVGAMFALQDVMLEAKAALQPVDLPIRLTGTAVQKTHTVEGAISKATLLAKGKEKLYAEDGRGYYSAELDPVTPALNVTPGTLPFTLSTQDEPHWYAMLIRPDNQRHYLYYDTTDPNDNLKTNEGQYNEATDNNVWAIAGNVVEGFEFFNKAAGWDMAITSPDPATTASGQTGADIWPQINAAHGTKWKIYQGTSYTLNNETKTDGFYLGYGLNGAKMNYRSTLAFWTGGADIGSTFVAREPWDAFVLHNNIVTQEALQAVADASSGDIRDEVGYYSQEEVDRARQLCASGEYLTNELAAPAASTYEGQVEQIDNIRAIVSPNLPKHNTFYRIKGGFSQKYLYAKASSDGAQYTMGDNDDEHEAQVIWFLDLNNSWVGYANGKGILETYSQSSVDQKCERFTFKAETFARPYLSMLSNYSGSKYCYDGATVLNRNGSVGTGTAGSAQDPLHCAWTFEEVDELPVTISNAGYASFYTPVAVNVPDDIKAYVAVQNGDCLDMTSVTSISANQGVILKGAPGTYNFTFEDAPGNSDECALEGKIASARCQGGEYVLSRGTIDEEPNQIGFFPVRYDAENTSNCEILQGFKAFLPYRTATAVKAFRFSFSELATAIDAAEDDTLQNEVIYNLNGQRVMKQHNGIVVINGKKVKIDNKH